MAMVITVALDGSKRRDLKFFAGDEITISVVVYAVDGVGSPLATVTGHRFSDEVEDFAYGAMTVPDEFTVRQPYRLIAEVGTDTTTLCYGYLLTQGISPVWPSVNDGYFVN